MKDRTRAGRRVWNTAATKDRKTKDRLKSARPRAELQQGRTDWYRIENLASGTTAVIHIYNEIGYWGTTAEDFIRELRGINASVIELHLNSPGGEAFEGIAIYNALKQHAAEVHVSVDSLAASIASVIAMAGDTITMATGSTMMIHNASGIEIGDAEALRAYADLLDVVSNNVAAIYTERAGGTIESWRAAMGAETWYTAEEAVAAGLADSVTPSRTAAPENSWDLSVYNYAGRENAPAPGMPAAHAASAGGDVVATVTPSTPDIGALFAAWMRDTVRNMAAAEEPGEPANDVAGTAADDASTTSEPAGDGVAADAPVVAEVAEAAIEPSVDTEPSAVDAPADDSTPAVAESAPAPVAEPTAPATAQPEPDEADQWAALTARLYAPEPALSGPDAEWSNLTKGILR